VADDLEGWSGAIEIGKAGDANEAIAMPTGTRMSIIPNNAMNPMMATASVLNMGYSTGFIR
jgi:hypothetical protein